MSSWLLPDHFADVLPQQARIIERLRRQLIDSAERWGFELIIPPLIEFPESLLTGTGQDLDLQTFKFTDTISGRTLGLRADVTPQVARIDAHLLNRKGVTRLCYAVSSVQAHAKGIYASRELMQFGAEVFGHVGLEADWEVQNLAYMLLQTCGARELLLDISDLRIANNLLDDMHWSAQQRDRAIQYLNQKDRSALIKLGLQAQQLLPLLDLHGDVAVIQTAKTIWQAHPVIQHALDELERLAKLHQGRRLHFDLADLRGYRYHSGITFALYMLQPQNPSDVQPTRTINPLVLGGRYDNVGQSFGRARPATGFSMDIRELAGLFQQPQPSYAIRAPWVEDVALDQLIEQLRSQGEIVVQLPPDTEAMQIIDHGVTLFFNRVITQQSKGWGIAHLEQHLAH